MTQWNEPNDGAALDELAELFRLPEWRINDSATDFIEAAYTIVRRVRDITEPKAIVWQVMEWDGDGPGEPLVFAVEGDAVDYVHRSALIVGDGEEGYTIRFDTEDMGTRIWQAIDDETKTELEDRIVLRPVPLL